MLLVLALVCWLGMLGSMARWIGKAPVQGRETDRLMQQLPTGILALLLWILLAALLLVANSKQVLPQGIGALAWIVHPVSLAAALAALVFLYDPGHYWLAIVPAVIPLLIAGYALYAFSPLSPALSVDSAGFAAWALVGLLSVSVIPQAFRFYAAHMDDGSIDATPGPALDRWMAKQKETRRKQELEELSKFDDETKMYEVDSYLHPDSPVRKEALEFVRHLPNREADVIMMLTSGDERPMRYIGEIDLRPTPELCRAARTWLHQAVLHRKAMSGGEPEGFVGLEFEDNLDGIAWIARNCQCDQELGELEAYARSQRQDAPEVQKVVNAVAAMRAGK